MTQEANKEAKRALYNDVDALVGFYESEGYINEFFQSEINQTPPEWMCDHRGHYQHYFDFLEMAKEKNIQFQYEDSYGGEGQGDEYWSVYSFSREGESVYVKFDGWYASYNGSEFNEWFFVQPKEKVITVYEKA